MNTSTSIEADLKALPEYAEFGCCNECDAQRDQAYRARLALARKWISGARHHVDCEWHYGFGFGCTCGRDALLKARDTA